MEPIQPTPTQPTAPLPKHASASKKRMWFAIAGVVVLAGITAYVFWSMNNSSPNLDDSEATMSLTQSGVSPATLKIKAGQSVTITNQDDTPHNLTADQEALPDFGTPEALNKEDSYAYIFDDKGTFRFYDPSAPDTLIGTIIVE